MLPMKARYAVKALVQLAQSAPGQPVAIAHISAQQGIPRKFLEAILVQLRNAGILASKRGKDGGYWLRVPPAEIALGDVLRHVAGPLAPVPCLSKTAYRRCDECVDEAACSVRLLLADVHAATLRIVDNTTLGDLVARLPAANPGLLGVDP